MIHLFKNKKILIMGLGLNGGGVGIAKFFCAQKADVTITDLKTKKQLSESIKKLKKYKIKYVLGGHKEECFKNADLIIKNPDVPNKSPYLEIARKNNIQIETDISLFFKLSKAFTIGVTGTKGKSTVASLIYHLLKLKYKRIFLAGNIGISPLEILSKIKNKDIVVLELSSFALENLKQSPNIALITNIFPDHLNRYKTIQEYIKAKKIIFKYQNKKDFLVLNNDNFIVRQFAKETQSKVLYFSLNKKPNNINISEFKLFGKNNISNLLAAIEVVKILKVPNKDIESGVKTFKGVKNRQEFVKNIKGVKYFNDTTATIPEAVISAIDSFSEKVSIGKIFLICGGVFKGVSYSEMANKIREKLVKVILLPGSASEMIKKELKNYDAINEVINMKLAVKKAKELTKPGDIVVLSPGASSFNIFKNEFDRGDQFKKFVKKIK